MSFRMLTCVSLAMFLLLPAASFAIDDTVDAAPQTVVERTLVVPLNLALRATAEVEPGLEPVWQELLAHLRASEASVAVLERSGAASVWNEVMADLSADGAKADVYEAYAEFARRVAKQADYSRIVLPSLVTRVAKVRGRTAKWDGIDRSVKIPGRAFEDVPSLKSQFLIQRHGADGELAAASLYVAVLTPDGELNFEGAGGLTLLQRVEAGDVYEQDTSLRVVERDDAFSNLEELRKGVEVAFQKPLPASRRK